MERGALLNATSTTRVKLLACEFLSDGRVHTRKSIINYVTVSGKTLGLPGFSNGCISGGIRQALSIMDCEKTGTATYRARKGITLNNESVPAIAAEICGSFAERMAELARKIDYIDADDGDLKTLEFLKQCVKTARSWGESFKSSEATH